MPPQRGGDAPMSEFERKRLANIEANRKVLDDVAVIAKKVAPTPPKRTTPSRPKTRTPVKRDTPKPTRQSSRLAGIDADNDTLKRKLEVEAEVVAQEAKAKKLRVNGDLSLDDISVEGKKWSAGVDGIRGLVRGAQPGVRTFTEDDVKETTDKGLKELRERIGDLQLYEHWAPNEIKITPQRVYALGFHPIEEKPLIFAGDKEGNMGIFDASQPAPEIDDEDEDAVVPDPIISAFKTHSRTITSFIFPFNDANSVYTSSYDSSIRKLDLNKGTSVQVWAPSDPDDEMPLSALDMADSKPNMLYFSTLDGSVGQYDTRTRDVELWALSAQKIGGFSVHPLQPHLLATASLDRTLKIWDMRKITGKGDLRHPALLGEDESRLSVSHASWSAGGHIATSSYDDTIKIYDFSEASSWKTGQDITVEPTHKVHHNNQTGRWRRPQDGIQKFVIGNMNRFVDVFAADGSQLGQLDGDGITAVPAVAHFHPSQNWVAGATSSGKLCFWQ
ncbi:DNA damage-binding protein cmr1 [Fusarium culmorum]|uniref:DNA damage-binding protein CMR1 n=1 Tax=Fusarium culmorum TaxID=5516 RepID=A0A2T4H152_FUSCU|nr:DNA damage-binding protein cmr1 [Fusarium culmorum]